jgi:hypothetical protein
MHLFMDSSTFLVKSSLPCLVFLFVSMKKSTKQNGHEHKLTCKEKCWVCVIFFACVCVGASDSTTASDDPSY